MQQDDFCNLRNETAQELIRQLGEKNKEFVNAAVEKTFKEMTDQEKIMTLSDDEVDLLIKFREWARSASSASGVFHWRKQYGK